MTARPALRPLASSLRCTRISIASRPFSTTIQSRAAAPAAGPSTPASSTSSTSHNASSSPSSSSSSTSDRQTHFGFETVTESEKQERVAGVFTSVAESYDRMNDLMSFGWHRIWKDHFVSSLSPGLSASSPPAPQHILDIAGGTGDIAFRMLHHAHVVNGNPNVRVTMSDINPSMLSVGKQRAAALLPASQQAALSFLVANAEDLSSSIPSGSQDLYTVAFGIRNFSNIPAALREAHRVLKPGGVFACLEFSKADAWSPLFNAVYKRWSFGAIPLIGQLVAGDRDSYQYLVESIERFPSQEDFRDMIVDAGFVVGGQGYENLTGGVAAIHKGMKPLTAKLE